MSEFWKWFASTFLPCSAIVALGFAIGYYFATVNARADAVRAGVAEWRWQHHEDARCEYVFTYRSPFVGPVSP